MSKNISIILSVLTICEHNDFLNTMKSVMQICMIRGIMLMLGPRFVTSFMGSSYMPYSIDNMHYLVLPPFVVNSVQSPYPMGFAGSNNFLILLWDFV